MTMATLIKESISFGLSYIQRLVSYHHGGKRGGMQLRRHGAGEVSKSSISGLAGIRKRESHWAWLGLLKP